MKTDNLLTLPDGRKLAYAEFGKPDGHPVLYCHSTPGSRLDPLLFGDENFSRFGLRVIAPDRPGMGESDFQTNRGFSDWPKDVIALTEALGINQFSVFGVSGGGGYAAVCAAKISEKLSKVVIAGGAMRIDSEAMKSIGFPLNLMWQITTHTPILLPPLLRIAPKMMGQSHNGNGTQDSTPPNKVMPAADHAAMALPGKLASFQQSLSEALRQDSKGTAWDMRLYVREWDFDPAEIQIPLTLFHGAQDRNYPIAFVQRFANSLPCAEFIAYPEDGHISIHINHFDEIAKALLPD
ncbi:MAG TPA: alpha/beta hydrolase [Anaerolineales bacterium]|nr:alpha/beta hydrolase [Anaerolineales bacterium]